MSKRNGDKARSYRERKKQIVRKKRTRELKKSLLQGHKGAQQSDRKSA